MNDLISAIFEHLKSEESFSDLRFDHAGYARGDGFKVLRPLRPPSGNPCRDVTGCVGFVGDDLYPLAYVEQSLDDDNMLLLVNAHFTCLELDMRDPTFLNDLKDSLRKVLDSEDYALPKEIPSAHHGDKLGDWFGRMGLAGEVSR